MDLFLKTFDKKNEKFLRVKSRRIGMELECFSNVHGRIFLKAKTAFISKKNFRSNKEFDVFKKKNPTNLSTKVLLVHKNFDAKKFKNKRSQFLHKNITDTDAATPLVILACQFQKFKFKKNKVFFIKACNAMVSENDKLFLVDNLKLECKCTFVV